MLSDEQLFEIWSEIEGEVSWSTSKVVVMRKIAEAGEQKGIREVVEFVNRQDLIDEYCKEEWQAFLKSKGLE